MNGQLMDQETGMAIGVQKNVQPQKQQWKWKLMRQHFTGTPVWHRFLRMIVSDFSEMRMWHNSNSILLMEM